MQLIGWLEPKSYYRPGPEAQRKLGSETHLQGGRWDLQHRKVFRLEKRDKKILRSQKI